jgi:hypothetical protein
VLPYDTLAAALDEPLPPGASVRALEDFLINDCFGTVRPKTRATHALRPQQRTAAALYRVLLHALRSVGRMPL